LTTADGSLLELTSALYDFVIAAEELERAGRARLASWADELSARFHARADFAHVAKKLQDFAAGLKAGEAGPRLRAMWLELSREYESLFARVQKARLVREGTRLDHVKPTNIWRNVFHVSTGVLAVVLYERVWDRTGMFIFGVALLGGFIFLDVLRRVSPLWNARLVDRIFGKISRPAEAHKIPTATYYLLALIIGLLILPQRAIEVGALVLAFGDPAASLAGKTWGRLKLWRDKSLAGTSAFAVVSFVVVGGFLLAMGHGPRSLLIAGAAALVGAFTELFSTRIDDNFTIPLIAGGVAALLLG
jgi:dolichol kinase